MRVLGQDGPYKCQLNLFQDGSRRESYFRPSEILFDETGLLLMYFSRFSMNGSKNRVAVRRIPEEAGSSGVLQSMMNRVTAILRTTGNRYFKVGFPSLCATMPYLNRSLQALHGNGMKTLRSITFISTFRDSQTLIGRTRKSEMLFGISCASGLIAVSTVLGYDLLKHERAEHFGLMFFFSLDGCHQSYLKGAWSS